MPKRKGKRASSIKAANEGRESERKRRREEDEEEGGAADDEMEMDEVMVATTTQQNEVMVATTTTQQNEVSSSEDSEESSVLSLQEIHSLSGDTESSNEHGRIKHKTSHMTRFLQKFKIRLDGARVATKTVGKAVYNGTSRRSYYRKKRIWKDAARTMTGSEKMAQMVRRSWR
jgi:hypothetical protein